MGKLGPHAGECWIARLYGILGRRARLEMNCEGEEENEGREPKRGSHSSQN